MSQNKCLFCEGDLAGNRSREPVFPQWLLDYLGIRDEEITPTHFSGTTGAVVSTRRHTLNELVAGRVCKHCSTGWMSRLEDDVEPNVISLISANKVVVDLESQERIALARWTAKIAYLLNFASNYHKNIPINHYRHLYSHSDSLPDRVAVFAQHHHGHSKFYWLQQAEWLVSVNSNAAKEVSRLLQTQSYKITLQFGKLMLIVGYLPDPTLKFVLWSGIHIPLWPHRGPIGSYEKDDFPWNDSYQAIAAFHSGLQVVHDEYLHRKHGS